MAGPNNGTPCIRCLVPGASVICDPDPLRADGPRFGKPGYMCCGCTTAVDSDCCEILNAAVVSTFYNSEEHVV